MTDKTQGSGKEMEANIKWRITKANWDAYATNTRHATLLIASPGVSSTEAKDVVWTMEVTRAYRPLPAYLPTTYHYYCWIVCQFGGCFTMVRANYCIYFIDKAGKRVNVVADRDRDFIKPSTGERAMLGEDLPDNSAVHDDGSRMLVAEIRFTPLTHRVEEQASRQWAIKSSELWLHDVASPDCSIEIGGTTLPAHKFPLMAHSPVFRLMFTNPLAEECKSGVVKVTDFKNPEAMKALIRYCYQGYVDVATMDGEWRKEIFQLAHKYRIDDLKDLMEKRFIDKTLNVENVAGMAMLADIHSAARLKEACIKLIAREWKAVYESEDWKELEKVRPELAFELAKGTTRVLNEK